MKFGLSGIGAIALCISLTPHAAENGNLGPAMTADKFVDALRHRHFKEAATMFAPAQEQDTLATERTLKRIDESLGGFATLHPVPTLPDGKSMKLEVSAPANIAPKVQQFLQFRYASTATDGQPVFYELSLSADGTPPRILSFGVHFPTSDSQLTARAHRLVGLIER